MRSSTLSRGIYATTMLYSGVFAGRVTPRQDGSNPLNPWISVDASGTPVATYTPSLTTINNVETTLNAVPYSLTATATTTSWSDEKPTETSRPGGSFQTCNKTFGENAPFCAPTEGEDVYVDGKYYVTWDPAFFSAKNLTIRLLADYLNDTGAGQVAYISTPVSVSDGWIIWSIQKEWLQGMDSNNVTLYLDRIDSPNGAHRSFEGPTVRITTMPKSYFHQPPTPAPHGQSLYIALPLIFAFIIVCVLGTFFWNRKHRRIGLGSIMGRRKGYGVGKSREQRLAGGDVELRDRKGAETGVVEAVDGHGGDEGNVFREELRRQDMKR